MSSRGHGVVAVEVLPAGDAPVPHREEHRAVGAQVRGGAAALLAGRRDEARALDEARVGVDEALELGRVGVEVGDEREVALGRWR
jgi:hypothetical protein